MRNKKNVGYIAFIDVLGFSDKIKYNDFKYVQNYRKIIDNIFSDNTITNYVAFADSIVLYTNDNEKSLLELIKKCSMLLYLMISKGYPIKGAISFGEYHIHRDKNGIFIAGKSIVDAHNFEQKQNWIGIILHPSVIEKNSDIDNYILLPSKYYLSSVPKILYLKQMKNKLPYPLLIHKYDKIPLLEKNNIEYYEGYVIIPQDELNPYIGASEATIKGYKSYLDRLKCLASETKTQNKYNYSITWANQVDDELMDFSQYLHKETI